MNTHHKHLSLEDIDRCLPQTQCTQCDYPRCRDYAQAILANEADINQCPPGGETTINLLASVLNIDTKPLNENHGVNEAKQVALIDEAACIGCKLCIKACPVDCIVGAGKVMHTVIQYDCTGCKLCLPVCPTDCIQLATAPKPLNTTRSRWPDFDQHQIERARLATERKYKRKEQREQQRRQQHQVSAKERMQKEIMLAVQRQAEKAEKRTS
ncbi:MAG: RnfABCDGE type electron transport complex subunit B [Gammaproteobacteria bacterium]|nr:RnfABCDGE type electron transport complex subunit B [Gammaproteobacteria bacterium]